MKQFINTKLFLAMQDVSQKGTNIDLPVLKNLYDDFVASLFSEYSSFQSRIAYRNALVYTASELTGMTKQLQEKSLVIFEKLIALIDRQIEWEERQIIVEQSAQFCPLYSKIEEQKALQWMGEPIELVELLYALHEAGCFGTISLKNLFAIVIELIGFEVKNHYALFGSIKIRTKGERTAFLDKLKRLLVAKMEKSDGKPSKK